MGTLGTGTFGEDVFRGRFSFRTNVSTDNRLSETIKFRYATYDERGKPVSMEATVLETHHGGHSKAVIEFNMTIDPGQYALIRSGNYDSITSRLSSVGGGTRPISHDRVAQGAALDLDGDSFELIALADE